jgi:phage baseplate assembly protein W
MGFGDVMATKSKAFLGVGWSFPLRPVAGSLRWASYDERVEQAIAIVLLTARGERVMLPQFGAGLRKWVFEPNSAPTHRALENDVRTALIDWEPRIDVKQVQARAGEQPNLVLLEIDFVVRATNTFYNRVYPFYLLEGRP